MMNFFMVIPPFTEVVFASGGNFMQWKVEKLPGCQCPLPRRGGTAKRWERNGESFRFLMVVRTGLEAVAVPLPPPLGGTLPPGEGIWRMEFDIAPG